jgi:hypothetical protein
MLENLVKLRTMHVSLLREADCEELRMMRLDPFVFLLGFRNGDSLASEAYTAPSRRGHQDF